jgi:hypothetical protein
MNTEAAQFYLRGGGGNSSGSGNRGENTGGGGGGHSEATPDADLSPSKQNALRLLKENLFVDSPRSILAFQRPSPSRLATGGFETERRALREVSNHPHVHARAHSLTRLLTRTHSHAHTRTLLHTNTFMLSCGHSLTFQTRWIAVMLGGRDGSTGGAQLGVCGEAEVCLTGARQDS